MPCLFKGDNEMKWEEIGEFAVDSGTFLICDPCYIEGNSPYRKSIKEAIENMMDVGGNNCCVEFSKDNHMGFAVVGNTLIGDGLYKVYQKINSKGQKEIKIVFK
jgi:hypothetical protein